MAATVLERERLLQEEIEQLTHAAAAVVAAKPSESAPRGVSVQWGAPGLLVEVEAQAQVLMTARASERCAALSYTCTSVTHTI